MAKKDKYRLPTGMAGLITYGEETKEGIKIKPKHVIAVCIIVVIIEVLLKFLG